MTPPFWRTTSIACPGYSCRGVRGPWSTPMLAYMAVPLFCGWTHQHSSVPLAFLLKLTKRGTSSRQDTPTCFGTQISGWGSSNTGLLKFSIVFRAPRIAVSSGKQAELFQYEQNTRVANPLPTNNVAPSDRLIFCATHLVQTSSAWIEPKAGKGGWGPTATDPSVFLFLFFFFFFRTWLGPDFTKSGQQHMPHVSPRPLGQRSQFDTHGNRRIDPMPWSKRMPSRCQGATGKVGHGHGPIMVVVGKHFAFLLIVA